MSTTLIFSCVFLVVDGNSKMLSNSVITPSSRCAQLSTRAEVVSALQLARASYEANVPPTNNAAVSLLRKGRKNRSQESTVFMLHLIKGVEQQLHNDRRRPKRG